MRPKKAVRVVDSQDEGIRALAEIACRAYSSKRGKPEVLQKAGFLAHFVVACPIRIREGEPIVGPHFPLEAGRCHGNIGHIVGP